MKLSLSHRTPMKGYEDNSERLELKCIQHKLDIAGTATEMHSLLFQSIKCPFQIPVAHFDQNRTIKYQF